MPVSAGGAPRKVFEGPGKIFVSVKADAVAYLFDTALRTKQKLGCRPDAHPLEISLKGDSHLMLKFPGEIHGMNSYKFRSLRKPQIFVVRFIQINQNLFDPWTESDRIRDGATGGRGEGERVGVREWESGSVGKWERESVGLETNCHGEPILF